MPRWPVATPEALVIRRATKKKNHQAWRKKNASRLQEKERKRNKTRRQDPVYRASIAAANRRWRKRHPDAAAAHDHVQGRRRVLRRYSITSVEYDRLLVLQNGVCAICRRPPESGTVLVVDHDHTCCPGKTSCGSCIRGLLHIKCNWALGHMNDDAARLRAAADYVEKNAHKAHQEKKS